MSRAGRGFRAKAASSSYHNGAEDGLVVEAFLDAVTEALASGDHIEIRGFGTFEVRHRKTCTARNPRTGEAVPVPARIKPLIHFSSRVDRGAGRVRGEVVPRGRRQAMGIMNEANLPPGKAHRGESASCGWRRCLRPRSPHPK